MDKRQIQTGTAPTDCLTGKDVFLRRQLSLRVAYTLGQPPALVFIHGGLGSRYNWRSQFEFAQARAWQVLAYDLAGHGDSAADNHRLGLGLAHFLPTLFILWGR
ncbi:MAG: alpha/beta hydrolase [Leptolyngbyaceae cyanobacterium SL_1_1]|nr:alpha/beta hydrolase [Leptolyngbyaceae cyanobacterium RM1_1_2]NJO11747.1 alpha/beta hydrolase [Leptolyngbyaceae cyanobacterium SL_1_1]